jgi:hypothetical protein
VTIYSRQVTGHSVFEFIGNIASAPQYAVLGEKLKQKYGKGNKVGEFVSSSVR